MSSWPRLPLTALVIGITSTSWQHSITIFYKHNLCGWIQISQWRSRGNWTWLFKKLSLTLFVFTLFSVMVELRSSVAAWIFVLELESLDLNRKQPLSPPFLLSCTAQKEKSPVLKPLDDSVEDINSVSILPFVASCCWILTCKSVKRINGLDRTFDIFLLTKDFFQRHSGFEC